MFGFPPSRPIALGALPFDLPAKGQVLVAHWDKLNVAVSPAQRATKTKLEFLPAVVGEWAKESAPLAGQTKVFAGFGHPVADFRFRYVVDDQGDRQPHPPLPVADEGNVLFLTPEVGRQAPRLPLDDRFDGQLLSSKPLLRIKSIVQAPGYELARAFV